MNKKDKLKGVTKRYTKWILGIAIVLIAVYLALANITNVGSAVTWFFGLFTPLIAGFFMALILNVPMRFFESFMWPNAKKKFPQKIRRPVAFILSLVLILGILAGVLILVLPELVNAVKMIVSSSMNFINEMAKLNKTEAINQLPFGNILARINWSEIASSIEKWVKEQSGTIVNGAMDTVIALVGGVVDSVFAVIFSVYILFSKEKLKAQAKRLTLAWLPEKGGSYLIHTADVANGVFRNFVAGQTIEAIILGTLCALGMVILRIPYAPMVSALVGVMSLIPVVGAFIGGGVGAFMIFTESPIKALVFVIFIIVLQQFEGNLIYPKVVGSQVQLPAIWVLAAVTVGGALAGPMGILLGIPITSTAYVLIREATEKREQKLAASVTQPSEAESETPSETE